MSVNIVVDPSGELPHDGTVPRRNFIEQRRTPRAVGKRLRLLRNALSLSMDQIADSIGMASRSSSWAAYETGKYMIPVHNAGALCDRHGITLDWLYRGLYSVGMPFDLANAIRALEIEPPKKRAR